MIALFCVGSNFDEYSSLLIFQNSAVAEDAGDIFTQLMQFANTTLSLYNFSERRDHLDILLNIELL